MGTVTYPNADVERYIRSHFVPVQFNLVEDPEGRECRRSLGYLDPHRFVGEMALARLAQSIHRRDYKAAHERGLEANHRTKGDPWREPEALYFAAVAAYKVSSDPA